MQTNSIDDVVLVAYNLVEELATINKLKHHVNLCFTSSNLQREIDHNISHRPFFLLPVPHRSLNHCYSVLTSQGVGYFQQLRPE